MAQKKNKLKRAKTEHKEKIKILIKKIQEQDRKK